MRRSRNAVLGLALVLAAACTPQERHDALVYADKGKDVSCMVANAFLQDVPAIAKACGLASDLFDVIRLVANQTRAAVRHELDDRTGACRPEEWPPPYRDLPDDGAGGTR